MQRAQPPHAVAPLGSPFDITVVQSNMTPAKHWLGWRFCTSVRHLEGPKTFRLSRWFPRIWAHLSVVPTYKYIVYAPVDELSLNEDYT